MYYQHVSIKILLSFSLIISLLFTLAGCRSSQSATEDQTSASVNTSASASASTSTSTSAGQTAASSIDAVSKATAGRYREGEVREYQGKFLSPAVGPRDNSISGVQKVDISSYSFTIDGLVNQPVTMTYDEVIEYPAYERLITLYCVEGWDATMLWKGVLIEDLLNKAVIKPEAVTVIFHATDNYTTSLPLETVREREMIMAYQANGLPLPPEMGYPFIVVAEDKLGYKWARWVTRIELSSDPDYKGYWEQAGYPNAADLTDY